MCSIEVLIQSNNGWSTRQHLLQFLKVESAAKMSLDVYYIVLRHTAVCHDAIVDGCTVQYTSSDDTVLLWTVDSNWIAEISKVFFL